MVLPVPDRPKNSAVSPVRPDVGRAVHRQDVALRQQKVQDAEDGLLDLAGVLGAADQPDAPLEVQDDECLGLGAVAAGSAWKRPTLKMVNCGLCAASSSGVGRMKSWWANRRVPGLLGDDADGQAVLGVGPGEAVEDEQVAALNVRQGAAQQVRRIGRGRTAG